MPASLPVPATARGTPVPWNRDGSRGLAALILAATLVAPACGDDDGGGPADAGPTPPPSGDSGAPDAAPPADSGPPEMCDAPATTCPEDPPLAGAPCEGTLSCPYAYPGTPGVEWRFTCRDGAFDELLACAGCPPIASESCRPPFSGTLAGGSVEVGPVEPGAFRPFADGERIQPQFGAQGLTMLFFRVRVSADAPPTCVSTTATVSLDGVAAAPSTVPVKLRCGESLRVFAIYPDNPCEFRDYPVHLELAVDGVGSTSVDLVLEGGMCPRVFGPEVDAGAPDAG